MTTKQAMLDNLFGRDRKKIDEEAALYGTYESQTTAIHAFLYQLAEPQSHRDSIEVSKNCFQDLTPISKYKCVQVEYEVLDEYLDIYRETFRMDDELCDDVELPHGSAFKVVSTGGMGFVRDTDELYIPNFKSRCQSSIKYDGT